MRRKKTTLSLTVACRSLNRLLRTQLLRVAATRQRAPCVNAPLPDRDIAIHRRHAAVGARKQPMLRHELQCRADGVGNLFGVSTLSLATSITPTSTSLPRAAPSDAADVRIRAFERDLLDRTPGQRGKIFSYWRHSSPSEFSSRCWPGCRSRSRCARGRAGQPAAARSSAAIPQRLTSSRNTLNAGSSNWITSTPSACSARAS